MKSDQESVQKSINMFSRVVAILVLFVLPGLIGLVLDRTFGLRVLALGGFLIGTAFGLLGGWGLIKEMQVQASEELKEYEMSPQKLADKSASIRNPFDEDDELASKSASEE